MTCHDPSFLYHLLNSHEGVSEILCVLHGRNVTAYLTQTLGKGGTSQTLLVKGEVDMIDGGVFVIDDNRTDHLADV